MSVEARRVRVAAGVALAALAVGACGDAGQPVPVDEVLAPTPSPSVSALPASNDPFAVPDPITAEYVERVYAELARIESEAIAAYRDHVESGGDPALPPQAAIDRFRAIYSEAHFPRMMGQWQQMASDDPPFDGLRRPLEQAYLDVSRLVAATAGCVVVEGQLNLSGTAQTPPADLPSVVVAFVVEDDDLNVTPWEIQYEYVADAYEVDEGNPCVR